MDMEWDDVDPIVKTVPWAKASITVNKDGVPRLMLTFSEPAMMDFGQPTHANVSIGIKEGKAMVRLLWVKGGKFELVQMEKGGGRVHAIPIKAPIPDGARELEPCELVEKSKTQAIFILPIDAWEKQLNQPLPKAPEKAAAVAAAPAAPVSQNRAKLNAETYLRSKGVRITKMAGDWWQMEGTRVPRMDVLARVNEWRHNASLASLGIDDIE